MAKHQNAAPLPAWSLAGGVVGHKAMLLALAAASGALMPGLFHSGNFGANFHWPLEQDLSSWRALFSTWDAQHFLKLAKTGYEAGAVSNNFYPLWPLLIRAAAPLFGGDVLLAALALSNAFSTAALVLFHRLCAARVGEGEARAAVVTLLSLPGALFLLFPYSESLFLLLAVGLLLALERGRMAWAAAAALLLPLCRPQGVLVVLPLAYAAWKERRLLALAAVPLLGFGLHLLWMKLETGRAFESFILYKELFPNAPSPLNLLDLRGFAASLLDVRAFHGHQGSALDRLLFLACMAALILLWRRERLLFFYALPMAFAPAAGLGFVSFTRHSVLVFPLALALAPALKERWWLLAGLQALQGALLVAHANNYWAG